MNTTKRQRLDLAEALIARGYDPDSPKATPGILADYAAEIGVTARTLQRAMNDHKAAQPVTVAKLGFWDMPAMGAAHDNRPLERAPKDNAPKVRRHGWRAILSRIHRARCSAWQAQFLPYQAPWVEDMLGVQRKLKPIAQPSQPLLPAGWQRLRDARSARAGGVRPYCSTYSMLLAYRREPEPEQNATFFCNPILPARAPDWLRPCANWADKTDKASTTSNYRDPPQGGRYRRAGWPSKEGSFTWVYTLLAGRLYSAPVSGLCCPVSFGRVTWDTVGQSYMLWKIGDGLTVLHGKT